MFRSWFITGKIESNDIHLVTLETCLTAILIILLCWMMHGAWVVAHKNTRMTCQCWALEYLTTIQSSVDRWIAVSCCRKRRHRSQNSCWFPAAAAGRSSAAATGSATWAHFPPPVRLVVIRRPAAVGTASSLRLWELGDSPLSVCRAAAVRGARWLCLYG